MIQKDHITGLQQMKAELGDPEITQVVDLIQSRFNDVRKFLQNQSPNSSRPSDGMCLLASCFFNEILRESGFHPVILQGEIEIAESSWLEHHISLAYLTNYWVTIDFTVGSELQRYDGVRLLVLVCRPDKPSLKEALKRGYNWWTQE